MPDHFAQLASRVRSLRQNVPPEAECSNLPLVVLLHGLGGDRDDWIGPILERNWAFDLNHKPPAKALGHKASKPTTSSLGLTAADFLSPRLVANARGADGSDDRSWWHALAQAGFPVVTYSQKSGVLLPFDKGPVAQLKTFMETLQKDLGSDPVFCARPVAIVGHSRGGLMARAYLGDPDVKADTAGRYPRVAGLITLSSPHAGSAAALLDERVLGFLSKVQQVLPELPHDMGNRILSALKAKVASLGSPETEEIRPGSAMYCALGAQEPIRSGVRCISVGGTSPRFLRIYLWVVDLASVRSGETGQVEFCWRAKPVEAKMVSPILDGRWLKALGVKLDEATRGRGDGLTADASCRFPASFQEEEHLAVDLNHGQVLWDASLQREMILRLTSFA